MNRSGRVAVYGATGYVAEVAFSAVHDLARRRRPILRTSAWMLPIYGLIQPLYEPLHDVLRDRPRAERAVAYAVGFFSVEYASGRILRRFRGLAPWDYREARWNVDGLIRLDYALLWAAAGVALEPLHDRLTRPGRRDG